MTKGTSPVRPIAALAALAFLWTLSVGAAPAAPEEPPEKAPKGAPGRQPQEEAAEREAAARRQAEAARGQLANVRVDVTITDQTGQMPPVTKTLSLTVADRRSGRVRTQAEAAYGSGPGEVRSVPLNVDVSPEIDGNKIRLGLGLNYGFTDPLEASRRLPVTEVSEALQVILESGKPAVVAQSADPITDRRITLEVKATILR